MPETPKEPDSQDDALLISRLCDQDADVLDALVAARALGADQGPMPPDSAQRLEKLQGVLNLLDATDFGDADQGLSHNEMMTPPADLASRTIENARTKSREQAKAEEQRKRFAEQVEMLTGPSHGLGLSFRQLASAAAVFIVSISLLLPILANIQNSQEQALCEVNLAGLGAAIGSYAQAHDGQLPRQGAQPGKQWWSIGKDPTQSNSAQLFVLVRDDFLNVDQMMCPSHSGITEDELSVLGGGGFVDFQRPGQISYSYANQFTAKPMILDNLGDRPIVSDKNPLFVAQNGQMAFDASVPVNSPSIAHRGRGHNVLHASQVVDWSSSPEMEVAGGVDNIWIIQGQKTYNGTEIPETHEDAFLSP